MRAVRLMALSLGILLAQSTLTVDQVVSFVRSSIKLKQSDSKVADYLRKIKLSQKLDDVTIENLQGEGAGPKTVLALRDLGTATEKLKPPPPVQPKAEAKPAPPPSAEEQKKIIEEVREYALNYAKKLPDFICTEVMRRYIDPDHTDYWRLQDTVSTKLTYFEQHEQYKVTLINGRLTDQKFDSLGGATSSGEFGSMLRELFEPETETSFRWDHWGNLEGQLMYVFAYFVEQSHSKWTIDFQRTEKIVPAYSGLVYVDYDTHTVQKVTLKAEGIPSSFPVQEAATTLDYRVQDISDRKYMLPLKAEIRMRSGKYLSKNEVEFRMYQKFSAESKILADVPENLTTPEPLPDSKTTEQPAKPK